MLCQCGLPLSLQHDTDTDSVTHVFLQRLLTLGVNCRSKASMRAYKFHETASSTNSTALSRRGSSHVVQSGGTTNATLHAPSHGPALATWCSAAARQIITKMNASCLLAPRASLFVSQALHRGLGPLFLRTA